MQEDHGKAPPEAEVIRIIPGVRWVGRRRDLLGPQHPAQREPRDPLDATAQLDRDLVDDLVRGATLEQRLEGVLVEHLRREPAGLQQDVVLAREVKVERCLRDPCAGGYLFGGRVIDPGVVTPLAPQLEGCLDDGLPRVPRPALRQQ
jgi:hypothetical protein